MCRLSRAVISLLLAIFFSTQAWGKSSVKPLYDEFSDTTWIQAKESQVGYRWDNVIRVTAMFACPGRATVCIPDHVILRISDAHPSNYGWKYQYTFSQTVILADNVPVKAAKFVYTPDQDDGFHVLEAVDIFFSQDDFRKVAKAKQIDLRLGTQETLRLGERHLQRLRELADYGGLLQRTAD